MGIKKNTYKYNKQLHDLLSTFYFIMILYHANIENS